MARAIGVCRLHDRARIDVHDDGSIVGLIAFRWLRPMAAASGVGGVAKRSDCEDGGQANGAPAPPTTIKIPPTQHPFSPPYCGDGPLGRYRGHFVACRQGHTLGL